LLALQYFLAQPNSPQEQRRLGFAVLLLLSELEL
jgi:hypothetical protein